MNEITPSVLPFMHLRAFLHKANLPTSFMRCISVKLCYKHKAEICFNAHMDSYSVDEKGMKVMNFDVVLIEEGDCILCLQII